MPTIVVAREYKVQDGDSIESLAKLNGMTWQELAKFNWGTDVPTEINKFLRDVVGCRKKTPDGHNYSFTGQDDPGIVYIPTKTELSFDSNGTHSITVKPPSKKSYIPAECEVSFRPCPNWNGEFGFDWMRLGDFPIMIQGKSINATLRFEDVVGYHKIKDKNDKLIVQPDGNTYKGTFYKDEPLYKKLKSAYKEKTVEFMKDGAGLPFKNYASYLSVYVNDDEFKCPQEVDLQAFIDVKQVPEQLIFKLDEGDEAFIETSITELPKATGKTAFKVKILKELDEDKTIEVIAVSRNTKGITQEVVVGRLIVVANAKKFRKKVKTLLVSMTTPALTPDGEKTGDPDSNIPFVKTILHQALIDPIITKVDLDFTTSAEVIKDFKDNYVDGKNLTDKGKINDKYLTTYCLEALLKNEKDKDKYKDYLVAFYTAEPHDSLYGYSLGHNVIMYGTALESTGVHEWLHSLGLPHTFTGTGTFTYKGTTTENIMDYTHHQYDPSDPSTFHFKKSRISLYHWQWLSANKHSLNKAE